MKQATSKALLALRYMPEEGGSSNICLCFVGSDLSSPSPNALGNTPNNTKYSYRFALV
jgi:hypothetical protein